MVLQKLDIYIQKMSLDSHHTQYLKIVTKWINDLTTKGKNLKLSEEDNEKNLYDIGFVNNLIKITLRAHAQKIKNLTSSNSRLLWKGKVKSHPL